MRYNLLIFLILMNFSKCIGQEDTPDLADKDNTPKIEYKETDMGTELFKLELKGKYGIKHKGQIIIPVEYDELPMGYSDRMIAKKDGKYGIINSKNKILIEFSNEVIKPTNRKEIVIASIRKDDQNFYGVYQEDGVVLTAFEFTDCNENLFYDIAFDYSCTCKDGKEKLFNSKGELLYLLSGKISWKLSNDYYRITTKTDEGKQQSGVIDKKLKILLEPIYDHANWIYKDRYLCLTTSIEEHPQVKIFDIINQKNIVERKGIFKTPNKQGEFEYHKKDEKNKWVVEKLNIEDLIKR